MIGLKGHLGETRDKAGSKSAIQDGGNIENEYKHSEKGEVALVRHDFWEYRCLCDCWSAYGVCVVHIII